MDLKKKIIMERDVCLRQTLSRLVMWIVYISFFLFIICNFLIAFFLNMLNIQKAAYNKYSCKNYYSLVFLNISYYYE